MAPGSHEVTGGRSCSGSSSSSQRAPCPGSDVTKLDGRAELGLEAGTLELEQREVAVERRLLPRQHD